MNENRRDRRSRESVLFIGTQFSILYTSMYSPAEAATLKVLFNNKSCRLRGAANAARTRELPVSSYQTLTLVNVELREVLHLHFTEHPPRRLVELLCTHNTPHVSVRPGSFYTKFTPLLPRRL